LIAGAALLLVLAVTVRRWRAAALDGTAAASAWPCVVARAGSTVRPAGPELATQALDALAEGPRSTRSAARRQQGSSTVPRQRLAAACERLASTRSDRLHAAVVVAGAAAPDVLGRLWRSEVDDLAHHEDWAAVTRVARVGRWLLLAPLAPVTRADGTEAAAVAVVAVLAWMAAGAWIDAARPRRLARCAPPAHLGAPSSPGA
jgi:hypothetical protein